MLQHFGSGERCLFEQAQLGIGKRLGQRLQQLDRLALQLAGTAWVRIANLALLYVLLALGLPPEAPYQPRRPTGGGAIEQPLQGAPRN